MFEPVKTLQAMQRNIALVAPLIGFSLFCAGVRVHAQETQASSVAPTITYFDVKHDPNFDHYQTILRKYARRHANHTNDDLCVLGFIAADKTKSAWVIWPKGNRIFVWAGNNSPLDSPQTIDLKKDVVPTDADVNGSPHLVTQSWVEKTITACKENGTKVHISAD